MRKSDNLLADFKPFGEEGRANSELCIVALDAQMILDRFTFFSEFFTNAVYNIFFG